MSEIKKVKRFVISKNGIKNIITCEFVNKKGERFVYNQFTIFKSLKNKFENMECWNKYNTYTSTNNLPTFVRELKTLV